MNKQLLKLFSEDRIKSSKDIFDGLRAHLEGLYDTKVKDAFSEKHYEKTAWSELQADKLGTLRTLQDLINLLKIGD